jgi:NAD-dependent SIR2 family protein deacetylase
MAMFERWFQPQDTDCIEADGSEFMRFNMALSWRHGRVWRSQRGPLCGDICRVLCRRAPSRIWTICLNRPRHALRRRRLPDDGHLGTQGGLLKFEKIGKCDFLISQNVDNLHLKSGFPPEKLAELHGNKTRFRCRPCEQTYPISDYISEPEQWRRIKGQFLPYTCPTCGRRLEKSVINIGETGIDDICDSAT